MGATMGSNANAIMIHEYGPSDVMKYESIHIGPPKDNEVQIQHGAIGVNFLDTYNREGIFPVPELPWGLGVEGAGQVIKTGKNVQNFKVGDRVTYASRPIGSYASVRNLPTDYLLHLPDDISYEQAAAVTLQGLTVHMLVEHVTRLGDGDSILVHAAAGGLGLLLVQWLKTKGCTVIGTVGSSEKAELARENGCDHIILYKEEPFVEAVNRLTGGSGVNVVFEGLGGDIFHESLEVLKPFGHIVNLGQVAEGLPEVSLARLGPVASLTVSVPGVFAYITQHPDLQGAADLIFEKIRKKELKVHIGGAYSLSKAKEAHDALEQRKTVGSLILIPDEEAPDGFI